MSKDRYPPERLLELGRELAANAGPQLTLKAFCRAAGCSPSVVDRRFGSWEELRSRLGLGPVERSLVGRRLSDEELVESLRRAAAEHGPNLTEHTFLRVTGRALALIYKRFGSWGAFRQAAGLPQRTKRGHSVDELLEKGRAAYTALGCNLGVHDFQRETGIAPTTIARHFGTWTAFRALIGQYPRNPGNSKLRKYSRDSILDQLRSLAEREGPGLTLKVFLRLTGISTTTFHRHFGSWPEARECVDLPPHIRQRRRYTDEFLLEDLHQVAAALGHVPARAEYESDGRASSQTLLKRYGPKWEDVQRRYERYVEYRRAFGTGRQRELRGLARERELLRLLSPGSSGEHPNG